ncbi:MAG: TonB-dependent receptor [Gemmatimonadetes bacterium]|nr:TonB-dependent receptor [Gemmatimonadota bacterium]
MRARLLFGSGLPALVLAASLVLEPAPALAQATGALRGTVVDATTQRPLEGVQVHIPGAGMGALTSAAGRFLLLQVPAGDVEVRVELIGYARQSRSVRVTPGETVVADFALAETAITLDELVVTGTPGATRAREIGNSVSRIAVPDVVTSAPVSDVTDLLTGRVAGLITLPGSGSRGNGGKIRIRGSSSLSLSNEPLMYVDGVRVDNDYRTGPGGGIISRVNDFNPEDIERIEIIKGPAAATLYGTEASNGVIQIITKKGLRGKPRVSLTVAQGANWLANPEGRIGGVFGRNAAGQVVEVNLVNTEKERGTPIFETGHLQRYGLSVSGGAEEIRYYIGASLDRDEGVFPSNSVRHFSGRGNLSVSLSERLQIGVNFGHITGRTNMDRQWSIMWNLAHGSPQYTATRGFLTAPPEAYHKSFNVFQDLTRTTAGAQIDFEPASWFRHRLSIGTDVVHEDNETIVPRLPPEENFFGSQGLGFKQVDRRDANYLTVDYSGTVAVDLGNALASKTSGGFQLYRKLIETVNAQGNEFPAPGVQTVGSAARRFGSDNFVENTTVGVFLQQQLGWKDRLFVTGAVRADDNSAFGENFELIYYPKVSATWVVSEEPFWNFGLVQALRVRAAYGASGNQPEAFAALQTFEPVTGPGDAPAVLPQFLGNPDLAPERGEELELGFEAGLLKDRVAIDLTYYAQRVRDAILLRPVAPSLGFPQPQFVNVGEVRNRGIELLISARPVATRRVDWDVSLNVSANDNKIASMGGIAPILFNFDFVQRHQEGYPIGAWFERKVVSAELDASGTPINVMCDGGAENQHRPVPCASAPYVYIGRPDPSTEGALSSSVRLFDRLVLSGMMEFKLGHIVWDTGMWLKCTTFRNCEVNFFPERFDPKYVAGVRRPYQFAYMSPADLAALRELSVSYSVPERWTRSVGSGVSATVTVAARNLHKWTKYSGLDPEVGRSFYGTHQDWLNYAIVPQLAQFVTTLKLNF